MDTRQNQRQCRFVAIWRIWTGRLQLKVSGTKETLELAADPKNPTAHSEAARKLGQTVIIQGTMEPGKDLRSQVPLQVNQVK